MIILHFFLRAAIFISLANAFVTVALQGREKEEMRREEKRKKGNEGIYENDSIIIHLSLVLLTSWLCR